MMKVLILIILILSSCTNATLSNGKNIAKFQGVKVFSPTVLSLSNGQCQVPSVDAAGQLTQPQGVSDKCQSTIMTTNGVDIKSFMNVILTTLIGIIAAVASGS